MCTFLRIATTSLNMSFLGKNTLVDAHSQTSLYAGRRNVLLIETIRDFAFSAEITTP